MCFTLTWSYHPFYFVLENFPHFQDKLDIAIDSLHYITNYQKSLHQMSQQHDRCSSISSDFQLNLLYKW